MCKNFQLIRISIKCFLQLGPTPDAHVMECVKCEGKIENEGCRM